MKNPSSRACSTLCRETCIGIRKGAPGGGFCVSKIMARITKILVVGNTPEEIVQFLVDLVGGREQFPAIVKNPRNFVSKIIASNPKEKYIEDPMSTILDYAEKLNANGLKEDDFITDPIMFLDFISKTRAKFISFAGTFLTEADKKREKSTVETAILTAERIEQKIEKSIRDGMSESEVRRFKNHLAEKGLRIDVEEINAMLRKLI